MRMPVKIFSFFLCGLILASPVFSAPPESGEESAALAFVVGMGVSAVGMGGYYGARHVVRSVRGWAKEHVMRRMLAGETYTIDKREYVDPAVAPFRSIVRMTSTNCTAQYVAPNILVTAAHCVEGIVMNMWTNYKDEPVSVEVISDSGWRGARDWTNDWAILRVFPEKNARYADPGDVFQVAPQSVAGSVQQAGFGALRILSDQEIRLIRVKMLEIMQGERSNRATVLAVERDRVDVNEMSNSFYALDTLMMRLLAIADIPRADGGFGLPDLFDDKELKFNKSCFMQSPSGGVANHNCWTYGGDSGSALWTGYNTINGIHVAGFRHRLLIGDVARDQGVAVDTKQFYETLQQVIRDNPPTRQ